MFQNLESMYVQDVAEIHVAYLNFLSYCAKIHIAINSPQDTPPHLKHHFGHFLKQ